MARWLPGYQAVLGLPKGFGIDDELDELCRIAWIVGHLARGSPPLSFTIFLIAFFYGSDPVSRWFQNWARQHDVDRESILVEKKIRESDIHELLGTRPPAPPENSRRMILTTSMSDLFRRSVECLAQVSPDNDILGTRHLMASYASTTKNAYHAEQLHRWGFVVQPWRGELSVFLTKMHPSENWRSLVAPGGTYTAPPPRAETEEKTARADLAVGEREAEAGTAIEMASTDPSAGDVPSPNSSADSRSTRPTPPPIGTPTPSPVSPLPPQTGTGPLIGRYTADDPYAAASAEDLLDVESEAAAFARIVAAKAVEPPLAIGIFGEWGAGKTYFLKRIQDRIERLRPSKEQAASSAFYRDIVPIRFNAWHYIETNLWASLVEYIFSALDAWIQGAASPGDSKPLNLVFNRLATAQQLQIEALGSMVACRSEQIKAERRAQDAREAYADALARSQQVRPDVYFSALMKTFLESDPEAKSELERLGDDLALPELKMAGDQAAQALKEARTEIGRDRLILRSLFNKVGRGRGLLGLLLIFLILPGIAVVLKIALQQYIPWLAHFHDSNVSLSTVIISAAAVLQWLRRNASAALSKVNAFDQKLQQRLDEQLTDLQSADVVKEAMAADKELQKRKLALEASERALAEANAQLAAARQEFEGDTARGRLNAFIRAKVTDGAYARHLGIIASIRKDFVQLASLMGRVNQEPGEGSNEQHRLRSEARLRVEGFLNGLQQTEAARLSDFEVRSLLALLDPEDLPRIFALYGMLLKQLLGADDARLQTLQDELREQASVTLPRFSRIVLYIDDLDRCPPDKVVDVLQAVHLLLCFPLFVVVVAVDARWVARALSERFQGLVVESFLSGAAEAPKAVGPHPAASSFDYLEKIFQIPFWVRPMEPESARKYVKRIASRDLGSKPPVAPSPAPPPTTVTSPLQSPAAAPSAALAGPDPVSTAAPTAGDRAGVGVSGPEAPPALTIEVSGTPVSMNLSDDEISTLQLYSPYVGKTPRHAIRFVNIYRLIKTSLPSKLSSELDLEGKASARGRALIPQLAIVNGSPLAACDYFRFLAESSDTLSASDFLDSLRANSLFKSSPDGAQILKVLELLLKHEAPRRDAVLTTADLKFTARTVQKYSFSARLTA